MRFSHRCVLANPEHPRRAIRNLGQRILGARPRPRLEFHSVKQEASPAAKRFTARTDEDRSVDRAGMDGVEIPGPSCSRGRGWPAAARDMVAS